MNYKGPEILMGNGCSKDGGSHRWKWHCRKLVHGTETEVPGGRGLQSTARRCCVIPASTTAAPRISQQMYNMHTTKGHERMTSVMTKIPNK